MGQKLKKYERVYAYIRTYIDKNKYTLNLRIPSEHFLCQKFSVSRETVRTAINILIEEGLLYAVQGSGTFFNRSRALEQNYFKDHCSCRIGFIAQGQDSHATTNILHGIKQELSGRDVDLKVFLTDNKYSQERECLQACLTGFDGLIIDGVKANLLETNLDIYQRIYENDLRVLFYNNYYKDQNFPKVIIDDARCADELVRYTTSRGHTHIAGIFVYDNYQGIEKYKGFIQSLRKYGAHFDDDFIKWCISDEMIDQKTFRCGIKRFLKRIPQASAIICCNYMILQMVIQELEAEQKRVPEDVSVACFDYSNADWESKGITASLHPSYKMGQKLGQTMKSMIEDPDYKHHDYSYTFQPTMYFGSSVKDIQTVKKSF